MIRNGGILVISKVLAHQTQALVSLTFASMADIAKSLLLWIPVAVPAISIGGGQAWSATIGGRGDYYPPTPRCSFVAILLRMYARLEILDYIILYIRFNFFLK